MNKTLLLIICDFLLISILALVEFKPDLTDVSTEEMLLSQSDADLIEVLKLSLENEDMRSRELADRLGLTEEELQARLEELERTESERQNLAENLETTSADLETTRESLTQTAEERAALAADLDRQRREANQLQSELQDKLAALDSAESNLQQLEQARQQWEQKEQRMQTDLQIRETEKAMLEQNLLSARTEVERARLDSQRAEERAERLAGEVGQLAERSSEIREEIRQAQPISLNAIFRRFEDNRVQLSFRIRQSAFLGTNERMAQAQSVVMEYGGQTYALFEASAAGLSKDLLSRLQGLEARITVGGRTYEIIEVSFLNQDSRVIAVSIPRQAVESAGIEPFVLARDPLQFPDAVLIPSASDAYGEFPIRTLPGRAEYLSIESRLLSRLRGEFTPSQGDFVFAKSGELIGMMVESNAARIVTSLDSSIHLNIGSEFRLQQLNEVRSRLE